MPEVESYHYPVKEGQRYININPGHLSVQQPPKGKGVERRISIITLAPTTGETTVAPQE